MQEEMLSGGHPVARGIERRPPRKRAVSGLVVRDADATCVYTGLDIAEQEDMLSSGHPVAWDMEHGPKSRELLAIVHRRGYDTEHWAVRIDRASQRVTHISAGPLLRTLDFKPEVSY